MAVSGHVDVRIAVVIVISHRYAKEKRAVRMNLARRRYIRKRAVAIVAIQRRLWRVLRMKKWSVPAVYKKRVQVAILVVIDPRNSRPHRLQIQFFGRSRALMVKMNPRLARNVLELHVKGVSHLRTPAQYLAFCFLHQRLRH